MNLQQTTEEEEDLIINTRPSSTTDICSQINLISSIQFQQNELSKLAKLLQSEKDREKYIKVIEMSSIIQSKLDMLQDEKNKTNMTISEKQARVNSFGQYLDKKNSMWSLNNYYYNNSNSCRSSTASSSGGGYYYSGCSSQASENTLATSNHSSSIYGCTSPTNHYCEEETFYNNTSNTDSASLQQSRYHIYNGHSYRVIDRITSLQFQQGDSVYNSRRPSADTILVDLCLKKEQEKVYVKPTASLPQQRNKKSSITTNKRASFIATAIRDSIMTLESDEDEEVIVPIHVAVRRDASLIKIEKVVSKSHHMKEEEEEGMPKNALIPVVPPIPPQYLLEQHQKNTAVAVAAEKKRVSFSDEKKDTNNNNNNNNNNKKKSQQYASVSSSIIANGLLTPPDSPQSQNQFEREISSESYLDLKTLPQIIHVQKKTHQSLKGLLKRTYQLNQYTVTKTNSISLPFSTGILYKACNSMNGKNKLLLKLVIVSLDVNSKERQRRFGFTFWWQNHHTLIQEERPQQEDAKFALAPDSLVKEALLTWIESQNEGVPLLPIVSQADEILRDGRKIYIVYDEKLFI